VVMDKGLIVEQGTHQNYWEKMDITRACNSQFSVAN
jgi:ABC-type multidrug transport system fused ATPase/permease subunit